MDSSLLKWTFVLYLTIALPASLSESIYNNDDSPYMAVETGIIDISTKGRMDVKTNLNLSPWELFVLNDLIFKLTTKQCPKLDKDVMSSFKELLSDAFKQAPMVEIQNEAFLPSYSHLVRCLDFVEDKPEEEPTNKPKNKREIKSDTSEEGDWTIKDAIITTTTTTPAPVAQDQQEEEMGSSWLWGFQAIHRWFKSLFPSRPETVTEENQEFIIEMERENEKKREQQRRIATAYRRARQNFANVFHEMSKIVRKTCPSIHQPDKAFVRSALLDMATWVTLDQRETISTAAQYFRKHELLKLLQDCFKAL